MKFEKRKLFPISWYRWNKGHDFNIFIFYLDVLILSIPLGILFLKLLLYICF